MYVNFFVFEGLLVPAYIRIYKSTICRILKQFSILITSSKIRNRSSLLPKNCFPVASTFLTQCITSSSCCTTRIAYFAFTRRISTVLNAVSHFLVNSVVCFLASSFHSVCKSSHCCFLNIYLDSSRFSQSNRCFNLNSNHGLD